MRIERATEMSDIEAAGALFDRRPDPAASTRFLVRHGHHLLVAYEGASAVGFVTGVEMTHPDKGTEMFLYELGVAEPHRRHGIGSRLVASLRDLARDRGCYGMWVLTDRDNGAATATYLAAGAAAEGQETMLSWDLSR
ncbi:MAG TPA: GNAT family N-acetyltransferase [Candidatus Dormibacteraeota bacterium]|jgi:ribosomal protein S18 acetylase RimI-like enzyme|nr:GNAT family N-acetyltransferase [Candidatus Dormibacteraeota bacterium]